MKTLSFKIAAISMVAFAIASISPIAFAKNNEAKESYSAVQVDGRPVFDITNTGTKAKPITIELDLLGSGGFVTQPHIWTNETIEPGTSKEYTLGPLFLTPANSPYHVALKIISANNGKLIDSVDPIAVFTVVH